MIGQPVKKEKLVVPLANPLLKLIRQTEVYLMEEAVTDQILKSGQGYNSGAGAPMAEVQIPPENVIHASDSNIPEGSSMGELPR